MRSPAGKAIAVLMPLALIAFLGWQLASPAAPPPARPPQARQHLPHICVSGCRYAGVALAVTNNSHLAAFAAATGIHPGIVESYQAFGKPFPASWVRSLLASKTLPLIQIDPRHASAAAIAAGHYDAYLAAYARAVRGIRAPVALSFGHEMNGHWYPWGFTHIQPGVFIAAWRHVHGMFARAGARNVIWVWTVSRQARNSAQGISHVRPWWPGGAYVNWVGLDIYYGSNSATFRTAFRPTIAAVRRFTHDPVLITETAAAAWNGEARQIRDLFAGAVAAHLLGVIWYDQDGRRRWYLNNRPAAAAAFRKGAESLLRHLSPGTQKTPLPARQAGRGVHVG